MFGALNLRAYTPGNLSLIIHTELVQIMPIEFKRKIKFPKLLISPIIDHPEMQSDIDWYTASGESTWNRYLSLIKELELDITYEEYLVGGKPTKETRAAYRSHLKTMRANAKSEAANIVSSNKAALSLVVYKCLSPCLNPNRKKTIRYFEDAGMEFCEGEINNTYILALVLNDVLLEYKEYLYYRKNNPENYAGRISDDYGQLYISLDS